MKKTLAIAAIISAAVTAWGEVTFSVTIGGRAVKEVEVREGARVGMTIAVEWPQTTMTYVVYTPVLSQTNGIRVCDHLSAGETLTTISQTVQRVVHHFTIAVNTTAGTVVETGPIEVQYRRSNETEPVVRQLAGVTFRLLPASRWPLVGSIVAGIVAVLGMCALWRATIRHRHGAGHMAVATMPSEDAYLARLDGLKHLRLEGNLEQYFSGMEHLLREYFKEKYRVASIETWQTPSAGPAGPDERTASVVRELLDLCRQVRYAGYVPGSHEQNRMYEFLKTLFTRNQPRRPVAEDEHYLTKETDNE